MKKNSARAQGKSNIEPQSESERNPPSLGANVSPSPQLQPPLQPPIAADERRLSVNPPKRFTRCGSNLPNVWTSEALPTFEALPYSHSLHICRSPPQLRSECSPPLSRSAPQASPHILASRPRVHFRALLRPPSLRSQRCASPLFSRAHLLALRAFLSCQPTLRGGPLGLPPTHPFLPYVAPHFSHISHFNLLSRSHTIMKRLCATSRRRRRGRCLSCPREPPTRRCVSSRMARGVCFG